MPRLLPAAARRRLPALLLLAAGFLVSHLATTFAATPGRTVDVVEVDGVIDQTVADYLRERIEGANRDDVAALVLQLDTPGGLGVSMDEILAHMSGSDVPIVVWVGPARAQALSAGTFIAQAAHVLAASPGTLLGAATPVDLGGGDLDAKVRNAAEGRLVALAREHGRNEAFAEAAVRRGAVVAIVASAAPRETPDDLPPEVERGDVTVVDEDAAVREGYVDLVASGLPELLASLNGQEVRIGGVERTLEIDETDVNVRFHNMGLVRRVLHTVANPTLAYLLIIAGALAMLFEAFQPGFGVSGVSGLVLFGLGLYGLSVLPVNWLAFGLVLLGLVLLAVDLAIAGLGALTAGGTVALAVGSFLLFTGPDLLRLSPWLIGAVVAANVIFFVVVMTTVLRAQGNQALVGAEALVGKAGVVRSMLNPEGHVFVAGALWRARAPQGVEKVKTGTPVRVVGLDDRLTLQVELLDEKAPTGS